MNLKETFKNIYCINLDRREDRWSESLEEFKRLDLEVNRFPATDGQTLNLFDRVYSGELGGTISHTKLIQYADDSNFDNILILEDDVEFSDRFEYIANGIVVPDDWDMLFFGGNHVGGYTPLSLNLVRVYNSYALHCYAVNKKAYKKIIDFMLESISTVFDSKERLKPSVAADYFMAKIHKHMNVYCVYPNIAWQRESFSDLQQDVMNYDFLKS